MHSNFIILRRKMLQFGKRFLYSRAEFINIIYICIYYFCRTRSFVIRLILALQSYFLKINPFKLRRPSFSATNGILYAKNRRKVKKNKQPIFFLLDDITESHPSQCHVASKAVTSSGQSSRVLFRYCRGLATAGGILPVQPVS